VGWHHLQGEQRDEHVQEWANGSPVNRQVKKNIHMLADGQSVLSFGFQSWENCHNAQLLL
jgi:hypothetical protein